MARPPLMWSTVRAMSASRSGLRYPTQLTSGPSCTVEVDSASAARTVQHSKCLPSGSPVSGKKWSQMKIASAPSASASAAVRRIVA